MHGKGIALLAALDRGMGRVENCVTTVAAVSILGLMLLGVAQVLGRQLVDMPVAGYVDLVEFAMPLFAFLGAAYCQRLGAHVRMELLFKKLKGRPLWLLEAGTTLVALTVVAAVIVYSGQHFVRAYQLGDSTMDIELPLWPSKLIVPAALSILEIRLLLQLAGLVRLVRHPQAAPIAVPV